MSRLSTRITSPEVNEVYKRNSTIYQTDISVVTAELPVATPVNPPILVESPTPPEESSIDPPASPAALSTDQRRRSYEWPVTEGEKEAEEVLMYLCYAYNQIGSFLSLKIY